MKHLSKGIFICLSFLVAVFVVFPGGCAFLRVAKGNYYLDNKKYREGIEAFEEELKANPESAEAQYFMGRFQLAENHPKEARNFLQQAVKLSPKKADYHFWLGVAYAANKESDLERKSYLRAIELDDKHVQALTYLGHNQLDKFEYENALNTYNKVLKLSPNNPSALYNRALILKHFGKTLEERLAWKEYLALYPSGAMGQQAAMNLNELGDFAYRNYLIGSRTVTLKKIRFEPLTPKLQKNSHESLDFLGEILQKNKAIAIHIVAYQKDAKKMAELRAKSIKIYLLNKFPEIESSRLMVSWFGITEEIRAGTKTFREDESINFITAVQERGN